MLLLEFVFLASIVVLAAVQLSKQADIIDSNSNLNPAFIGILLALATSLPELATGITSTLIGQSEMTLANVLGSNAFNVSIVAIMVFVFLKDNIYSQVSKQSNIVNMFVLGMYGLFIIGLLFPTALGFNRISIISVFILVLYYVSVKIIKEPEDADTQQVVVDHKVVRAAFFKMGVYSVVIVFFSIFLSKTAEDIMNQLGLSASFVGAIFIGVATSLPEFTSALNLCRLKKFDLAATSVLGSNLFNFTIISIVDIVDVAPLIAPASGLYMLCLVGIVSTIFTMVAIKIKGSIKVNALMAALVISTYLIYIVLGG